MTEQELNRACAWLVNNLGYYDHNAVCIGESLWERIAKDFREAMSTVIKDSLTTAENNAESRFIDKACAWLEKYMESLGYIDEWCRNGEDDFRKAMTDKTNPTFEKCLANVNPETRAEVRGNMDYADWTEKACEVIDELCKGLQPHRRNFTIEDFREAMGAVVKESLTTELTWQDMQKIVEIAGDMVQTAHDRVEWEDKSEEEYYTEVLRRFKED